MITELCDNIPVVLLYILPGFIGICVHRILTDRKINADLLWAESIGLSYVGLSFAKICFVEQTEWGTFLLQTVICCLMAIAAAKIIRHPKFQVQLVKHFSITTREGVLNNAIDWVHGCEVFLTMKEGGDLWFGTVEMVSNPSEEPQLICISAPQRVDQYGERLWPEDINTTIQDKMVFHLEDVRNIRFIYPL